MARSKLDFVVRFFGRLLRIRTNAKLPTKTDGLCVFKPREIRIHHELHGSEFFETLLHEALHHAADHLDEEWVGKLASEFTAILFRPEVLDLCDLQPTPRK